MANDAFVLLLALALALLFRWGFTALPREEWQILASLPRQKASDEEWRGLNLTYYGLFTATATGLGSALLFVLLGAVAVPVGGSIVVLASVLLSCVPAAKIIARLVERKRATFTVGGASFLGILIAPGVLWGANELVGPWLDVRIPLEPALAAMAISYALGEGVGRLACISFGCCYGRPLARSHPLCQLLFGTRHFAFTGRSKKAAYEGGLEQEPVIPIQAVTAVVSVGSGLLGMWLFLHGFVVPAFVEVAVVTQAWRALSETVRADYRGPGAISAYQVMAIVAAIYALALSALLPPGGTLRPDVLAGIKTLWSPSLILLLQIVWLSIFLYTGRSVVTSATISIFIVKERI
jgi:hypothetical protein